jgi:hypothetical protein
MGPMQPDPNKKIMITLTVVTIRGFHFRLSTLTNLDEFEFPIVCPKYSKFHHPGNRLFVFFSTRPGTREMISLSQLWFISSLLHTDTSVKLKNSFLNHK